MAYNQNQRSNTRVDRFGNPYKLAKLVANKNGYPQGFVDIGNQTFKVEVSEGKKQDSRGRDVMFWVKLTKLQKRTQQSGF